MAKNETFARALSEILVRDGVISLQASHEIQKMFKESAIDQFDYFLLQEGLAQKKEILKALGSYYQVPAMDVVGQFFDSVLLNNFPEEFLVRNEVIPLEEENEDMLVVVAADPEKEGLESAMRNYSTADITFMVGIGRDIIDAVREYYDKADNEENYNKDVDQERREETQTRRQTLEEEDDGIIKEYSDEDDITEE